MNSPERWQVNGGGVGEKIKIKLEKAKLINIGKY